MKYLLISAFTFLFISCSENQESQVGENWDRHDLKTKQYLIEGKKLYSLHCANCHMEDGKGLAKLIPPLANSDYMLSDIDRTICIIKRGKSGEIMVNNEVYNHPMPGIKNLTPIEVAQIATFIYNSWGHEQGIITISEVKEALKNCVEK